MRSHDPLRRAQSISATTHHLKPAPTAVIRDGEQAVLVIFGKDKRLLGADLPATGALRLVAGRGRDAIFLQPAQGGQLRLRIDPKAELDLRTAAALSLAHTSTGGFDVLIQEVSIEWSSKPNRSPH
ncbi:hypothetical protein AB9K35_07635 [Leisingera sp. XS_AS12]|uniref:hypothetical protein n=1 Tax=Leisingera sp. XS_AS12 TaxID=3241294 RepID=UPI003517A938